MPSRKTLALTCAAALVVTVFALVFAAGAAHGSDVPAVRGAACAHIGEHRSNRSGTEYVCEQRPGDRCPVWHAAHPVRGNWPKPSPCACPSKPVASHSSPAAGHSMPGSPRPPAVTSAVPAADQLPVTGTPTVVVGIAATGGLLIVSGAALLLVPFRRRRRNT